MQLKKIDVNLQKALIEAGFTQANKIQQETFSTIKSGADTVVLSPEKSGKTITAILNVIQKLKEPFQQSPRALIIVPDKETVLHYAEIFQQLAKYNKLRVFEVYDKTDIDEEKNMISLGIDILIGTPTKINALFAGAGFDVNRLQIIVFDNLEILMQNRYDVILNRLLESLHKGQKLFLLANLTEKAELFIYKWTEEAIFFDFEENPLD